MYDTVITIYVDSMLSTTNMEYYTSNSEMQYVYI